jgi:hypothetical protein
MNPSRASTLPILVLMMALTACTSDVPPEVLEPTAAPSSSPSAPAGLLESAETSSPVLADRNCTDFASPVQAQEFYIEAGGPEQDLHGLDPDRNGNACDDDTAAPAASAGGTQTTPQQPVGAPATAGPPQEVHSSSGAAAGKSGGSSEQSSCSSSDESGCD